MKKFLFAILIVMSLASNAKCNIKFVAAGDIFSAVQSNGFSFKGYDKLCSKINSVNAQIYITGGFLTLDGKNVATITVQLLDTDTMLIADGNYNTYVTINNVADDRNKLSMISETVNNSIGGWNIDSAIKNLNLQRQKIKEKYGK